jgi:hypothetical protein
MLHRLQLPPEAAHLTWVIQFQERLMRTLCDAATTPAVVTAAWVRALWPDAGEEWIQSFCNRRVDKVQTLEAMRMIAGATATQKAMALQAFSNDIGLAQGFQPACVAFRFHGVAGLPPALADAIEHLFLRFYDPLLDPNEGYPAPGLHPAGTLFVRAHFIAAVMRHNDLGVCPYCDGPLDKNRAKLDHFYPKSSPRHQPHQGYPFLAVLPENLVPACTDCNSLQVKGTGKPLTSGDAIVVLSWFHPYHRTADAQFHVEFRPPRHNDEPRHVTLVSDDPLTIRRLENLNQLFGITDYWGGRMKHQMDGEIRALRAKRRKEGTLSDGALRTTLEQAAESALNRRRKDEFTWLREAWCRAAAQGDWQLWPEFQAVNQE